MEPVHLADAFASFDEHWSPRIAATVNDYDVKIAKVAGEFPVHAHDGTDEFFLVLEGRLVLELPDEGRDVVLGTGGVFTVPRGVRHRPVADPGTRILMFEPRGTVNTGDSTEREGTTGATL